MTEPTIPMPPLGKQGFPAGPMLYPRLLRQAADLIEALQALESRDPAGQEGAHYAVARGGAIALYDIETEDDNDPLANLTGWVVQIDAACWVFVPYEPKPRRRPRKAVAS